MNILELFQPDSTLELDPSDFRHVVTEHADNPDPHNPDNNSNIVVPYTPCYQKSIQDFPPSTKDEIMALGYPSPHNYFEKCGFVYSVNEDYRVSRWVAECLTQDQMNSLYVKRRDHTEVFYEDDRIDIGRRAVVANYHHSGYDRGHLAAAGNHRYNIRAYENTFCLSNIAPMYTNVNEIIRRMENLGRSLASSFKKVYITTGTVIDPNKLRYLKDSKVAVPNAFFKVMVCKDKKKDQFKVWPFLVENSETVHHKDIEFAWTRMEVIKLKTGLSFPGSENWEPGVKNPKIPFGRSEENHSVVDQFESQRLRNRRAASRGIGL